MNANYSFICSRGIHYKPRERMPKLLSVTSIKNLTIFPKWLRGLRKRAPTCPILGFRLDFITQVSPGLTTLPPEQFYKDSNLWS